MTITEAISPLGKPMVKHKSRWQWLLVIVLASVVAIAALPSYFSGQWPWQAPLKVPQLAQVKSVMKTPLSLPGWNLEASQTVNIGGKPWMLAEYRPDPMATGLPEDMVVLLKAQSSHEKQPEVEWVDLAGSQGWQVADRHTVNVPITTPDGQSRSITTRYFRGIDGRNTFAIMQWYAWPQGGHFAPGRWFWADQARQWQKRQRLPWIAVSVLIPIEPVGNIRPHTEAAIAIAQTVQTTLWNTALVE